MSPHTSSHKAFTLIELLVVVAIISILTAIVMTNFGQAKAKSRDAKRVSDVAQLQLALEIFFDRCNRYPHVVSGTNTPDLSDNCVSSGSTVSLSSFISQIPTSPSPGSYKYAPDGTFTDYVIQVPLETSNIALVDSYHGTAYSGTDCSGQNYCVVPK